MERVRTADPMLLGFIALGVLVRIVYWAVTKHRFEDGLITVTHARNAAEGLGLTSHPGEGHVYGFTSAVSVLVPFVGELVKEGAGFVALRLTSLVMIVVTLVYANALAQRLGLARWATAFVLAYLALDYNNILYAMGGMETQIAVGVLLAAIYYLLVADATKLGLALGLCVLTRPDFLLFVAPALVAIWMTKRSAGYRAAALAAAVVLPWVIFTTAYYGSPVPHTIVAKQASYTQHPPIGHTPASVVHFLGSQLQQHADQWRYLVPFRENFSVVGTPISSVWLFFLALGMMLLAVSGVRRTWAIPRWWAAVVYAGLFIAYKLTLLPPTYYEWYLPPFMAITVLLVGRGLTQLALTRRILAPAFAVIYGVLLVWQFAAFIPIDRDVQHIENHVRTQVGTDLRAAMKPGEAVSAESAGYIGYYSHQKLYDYPGLTSPTALKAVQKLGKAQSLLGMINVLRPQWLALRNFEYEGFQQQFPQLAAQYSVAGHIAWSPSGWKPAGPGIVRTSLGVTYYDGDQDFYILHKAG